MRNKIGRVQEQWKKQYSLVPGQWGFPHIVVARFSQYTAMEERVVSRLRYTCLPLRPFRLQAQGYRSWPSHSIGLQVSAPQAFTDMMRSLRQLGRMMKAPQQSPYFTPEPWVTMAMRLKPWQYEAAWGTWQHHHFSGSFVADGLLLLRRREGERGWQIVQRLAFENMPVEASQTVLF
jgi:2'-5' RNA ligase